MDIQFTQHAATVMYERAIPEEWIRSTLDHPDRDESMPDGTVHQL